MLLLLWNKKNIFPVNFVNIVFLLDFEVNIN